MHSIFCSDRFYRHRLGCLLLIFFHGMLLNASISLAETHETIAGERLLLATLNNDMAQVIRLLDTGVDPDFFDVNRNTALIYAARDGRTEIAEMLLKAGASPGWIDGEKVTPLILGSYKNHIAIVKLLLARNVSRTHRDKWGRAALDYAKRRGTDDPVYKLLKQSEN